MKQCIKCGEIKSIEMFTKKTSNKDGHTGACQVCSKQYKIKNREKNNRKYDRISTREHYTVYLLSCGDGSYYVGSTGGYNTRLIAHKSLASNYEGKLPMYKRLNDFGYTSEILFKCATREDAYILEDVMLRTMTDDGCDMLNTNQAIRTLENRIANNMCEDAHE